MNDGTDLLERTLLTARQREILRRPIPRWDLDPPQREDYTSDTAYVADLRAYADRVHKSDAAATFYGRLRWIARRVPA